MTKRKRILVATYHSYIDQSSGAAISLRDMMEAMAKRGWEVRVLSGPKLDFESAKSNDELLREQRIEFQKFKSTYKGESFQLFMYSSLGTQCATWVPNDPQSDPNEITGEAWLGTYSELLESWEPDVMITYGGFWMSRPMLQMARTRGIKTVFYLCNFAYTDRELFSDVDATVVLSQFQSEWYRERLGIASSPVYPMIPKSRYRCDRTPDSAYVKFVNPQPHKGLFLFAKIAEVLATDRPEIPFLVVESRATTKWLGMLAARMELTNVFQMANTPDSRDYLSVTKIMLMPSVWQESFGRIAAEAMLNGIPVIGSSRGAIPEVIGENGMVLDIPSWMTVESRVFPEREEVLEWTSAIERLWDDAIYYQIMTELALQGATRWDESIVAEEFDEVLTSLIR